MPVIYQEYITREDVKQNRLLLYVFGNNLENHGLGGQAAEMRGEFNAVGIPTKVSPSRSPKAYFKDEDFDIWWDAWENERLGLMEHVIEGGTVVWPLNGIGTGLAKLKEKAPKIWNKLEDFRKELEARGKNWPTT